MILRVDGWRRYKDKNTGRDRYVVECSSLPAPVPSANLAGRSHTTVWLDELPDDIQIDHEYEVITQEVLRSGRIQMDVVGFITDRSDLLI